jgi:hypothetical protein
MTDAFTCSQTFAAYYNQTYGGDAESLADLWANDLATPYDSLCAGECLRTGDLADLFDVDNDIGRAYAGVSPGSTARLYPQSTGLTYDEEFWRLYRELTNGFNTGDGHEQTVFEFADEPDNKLGAVRWYRYVGTGQRATISILNLGSASCNDDVLDMAAYSAGREIASDYNLDGCPSVSFATTAGTVYTVIVYGLTSELPAWDIRVASPKKGPPVRVSFRREGRTLSIDTIPTAALRSVRIKLRGHPTKTVTRIDPVPGVAITQQLTLHGDETGFAIADLELTTRDGRTYRTSRPYPLSKPRPKLSGELASDGQGGYLHLFSAMQR